VSARKIVPRRFGAAEAKALRPFIVRAVLAAVRQSEACANYYAVPARHPSMIALARLMDSATAETNAAGQALAAALRKIRGGK